MNILFISEDLVAANLTRILQKEGHKVKLHIKDRGRRGNFTNLVPKTEDWRKELNWVGKNGLIIFDSGSHGKIQESLRKKGYSVVGGSYFAELLENDREIGQRIFEKFGLNVSLLKNFSSTAKAINFVKKNRGRWVIKQNISGTGYKSLNYVGELEQGEDVIDILGNYESMNICDRGPISLQRKVEGVEVGVGRYFNGNNWVGPIEINLEHKKYFPGNIGPATSEMGTLAWYDNNEKNKLFVNVLANFKSYLKKINFRGDFEINCIVNEKGAFPLEATARFGSPIVHLQSKIHKSPWGEFLKAVADKKPYSLKWKKGYGVVVVITVPTSNPFPFTKAERYVSPKGIRIHFDKYILKKENFEHVHFEDVSVKTVKGERQYYISDDRGYVLYVTGMGKTVAEARKKAYGLIKHIHIPKMFYRNDIGLKFIEEDEAKLKKWGYL
jgi:phosphoribosylamine---glycine ligase